MLKRLLLSGVLIITAAALCISSFLYIRFVSEDMLERTDRILTLYENEEDFFYETKELIDTWNDNSLLFGIVLKHTDADSLDRYFLMLESTLQEDNVTFIRTLIELRAFLKVCLDGEKPRADNIF